MRLQLAQPPLINLGPGGVVIDVQRPDRQVVLFSHIRSLLPACDPLFGCSKLPIGIDLQGDLKFADLAATEHFHMLVAGGSGSGKSEWLRSAIAGLLATNTPETLRLVLIDAKRDAFLDLRQSPFLLRPIVFPDEQPAADVLETLAQEMERRYRLFDGAGSLQNYVTRTRQSTPRIVVICDEYFDLDSNAAGTNGARWSRAISRPAAGPCGGNPLDSSDAVSEPGRSSRVPSM